MVVHGNVMAAGFIGSMREIFRGILSPRSGEKAGRGVLFIVSRTDCHSALPK
jgi:hypothetical protein